MATMPTATPFVHRKKIATATANVMPTKPMPTTLTPTATAFPTEWKTLTSMVSSNQNWAKPTP